MTRPMTREQALRKAEETSRLNGRPFKAVKVIYLNGQSGWDVTPEEPRLPVFYVTVVYSPGRFDHERRSQELRVEARCHDEAFDQAILLLAGQGVQYRSIEEMASLEVRGRNCTA